MRRNEAGRGLRWRGAAAGLLILAATCAREPVTGMSREQFIDVVTQLRLAAAETTDPAEWQARRDSVLAAAGVTDSALVAFAAAHGERIPYMLEVWDTIEGRLRPLEPQDTAARQ